MYEFHTEHEPLRPKRKINWKAFGFLVVVAVLVVGGASSVSAPPDFPAGKIITIDSGSSLDAIAKQFADAGIIRSVGMFKTFIIALSSDTAISDGDYLFERHLNAWEVAERLAFGRFGVQKITVRLPEGLSNKEMAAVLRSKLPAFNEEEFLYLTKDLEGYLFPDTYYFFGSASAVDVVKMMRDNFNKKVADALANDFESSDKTIDQIITMASIIQAEAYDGYVEKQMISGILWKRIAKGMKLQVDATTGYHFNKTTAEITAADRAEDSPYNTYLHTGLPPTPIGNPGVEAIKAALYPIDSPYFFYLHDKSATIHYAKTYEEHKKNINNFLKK
jgi:UPF0755 protein